MKLCATHREQWMEALDVRAVWRPALVQIGGQREASLIRHVKEARKHRFETWRATVRHLQTLVEQSCAQGRDCNWQPALFEEAA